MKHFPFKEAICHSASSPKHMLYTCLATLRRYLALERCVCMPHVETYIYLFKYILYVFTSKGTRSQIWDAAVLLYQYLICHSGKKVFYQEVKI